MPADVYVDVSEAEKLLGQMRDKFSEKTLENRMRKAVDTTARKAKTIIKKDVNAHYFVSQQRVGRDILPYRRDTGGIGCIIPIQGVHGTIGAGKAAFKVSNPKGNKKKGKGGYRFKEVRSKGTSTLPATASGKWQGGGPIFLGPNKLTFTRKPGSRKLARVTAEAVAHHVSTEARKDIEDHLGNMMLDKLESLLSYDAGLIKGD